MTQEWRKDSFLVSTDRTRLDLEVIHDVLTQSYWAKLIPVETVSRSIANSLCFGLYRDSMQIGFARVVSDLATFAYLADVFVIEDFQKLGLSKWLLECILSHPDLQGLRRWCLGTRDAHDLYKKYGFTALKNPERYMEIARPDIYQQGSLESNL